MGIPDTAIVSLNKSRQRAVYQRQLSNGEWVETNPLPADPASINYYLLKGFRAPPKGTPPQDGGPEKTRFAIQCPLCEFTTQSAFGLQSHLRKHIKKEKKP